MSTKNEIDLYYGIIAVMVSFFVIAAGAILFFIRYQKNMLKKQEELHRMESNHRKELLASSIQSAEEERLRIAKDIHDEIGSIFSTLSLSVGQLKNESTLSPNSIRQSNELIQAGINSVRRISHGIVPFELELLGLHKTLENYFKSISTVAGIDITFNSQYNLDSTESNMALAIYRIAQELLSNCIKHAKAEKVDIEIYATPTTQHLILKYKDNGVGINLNDTLLKKGIGLKNIESRALSLDGTVEFNSLSGNGFNCLIRLPLKH